jgi:formylglycine-generating enzyme
VTNSQYVAFLNSNDPTGANLLGLYNDGMPTTYCGIHYNSGAATGSKYSVLSGDGNRPVNFVTFFDALRFANWLDNGQVPGSTERGAYTLLGGTPLPSNFYSITRNAGATVFLPSEDEWYKAAFYNPNTSSYNQYPTGSSQVPNASGPTAAPNSANYNNAVGNVTDVGAYTGTTSPYGAYDMGGNVFQWNEATFGILYRGLRGGAFFDQSNSVTSLHRSDSDPRDEDEGLGFRLASIAVPEPSTGVLAGVACGLMWILRKRFK